MTSAPRPMKIWRITGSRSRTSGDIGMSRSTGTSRQPSTTWPSAAHGALEFLFAGQARGMLARQEDHADAVFPRRRQVDALLRHFVAVKRVRNLDQDAGAIAHSGSAPTAPRWSRLCRISSACCDHGMARATLDVRDEANATGVVFMVRRRTDPARRLRGRGHGGLLSHVAQSGKVSPTSGGSRRSATLLRATPHRTTESIGVCPLFHGTDTTAPDK